MSKHNNAEELFSSLPELRELLMAAGEPGQVAGSLLTLIENAGGGTPQADILKRFFSTQGGAVAPALIALHSLAKGESAGISTDFIEELGTLFGKLNGTTESPAVVDEEELKRQRGYATEQLSRYRSGLEREVTRQRHKNRVRIVNLLGGTPSRWDDWFWQTRNRVSDAEVLAGLIALHDDEAAALAKTEGSWQITPHYLSLLDNDPSRAHDRALRHRVLPIPAHRHRGELESLTVVEQTAPFSATLRPHPALLQIDLYRSPDPQSAVTDSELQKALDWFGENPHIEEAIIAGGDLLCLEDNKVKLVLSGLARHKHIRRISLRTDFLLSLPQRFTSLLTKEMSRRVKLGELELSVITGFAHAYEVTPDTIIVVERLREAGVAVFNETPLTVDNSRRFELAALRRTLRLVGIIPRALLNVKDETASPLFRVPLARLQQELAEEAALMPELDSLDMPTLVLKGRRYPLHTPPELIALRPEDGRRVYRLSDGTEFVDASLPAYLRQLKEQGEDPADYRL